MNEENNILPESSRKVIMDAILAAGDEDSDDTHICRVCRLAGDKELFHPCQCIGSIKFVHQDCLMKWLKYSKKEVCELCNHKFHFRPVYSLDMPPRLPLSTIAKGMFGFSVQALRSLFTYLLVCFCWFVFVPFMASRIHKIVFSGNALSTFLSSKIFQLLTVENAWMEIASGVSIVSIFLSVWLREQIMTSAPADFLHLPVRGIAESMDTQENGQPPGGNANPDHNADEAAASSQASNTAAPLLPSATSADAKATSSNSASINESSSLVAAPPSSSPEHPSLIQPQQLAGTLFGEVINEAQQMQQQPHNREDIEQNLRNAVGGDPRADPERVADDLTWQKLLGLDGSFVFIEHVFWTVSLNLVFDVLFRMFLSFIIFYPAEAACTRYTQGSSIIIHTANSIILVYWPEQLGLFILRHTVSVDPPPYFQMPCSMLVGYVAVMCFARVAHSAAKLLQLKMLYTASAIVYLMLKVLLLIVLELLIFPALCGWWLDICSLPLTGGSLEARIETFRSYPSSSTFLHWLVGMIYVFYSASFILLLKELLRPGVLWFIRNLNDPEFNPILEMIDQPLTQHFRRLVSSTTLFFTLVLLVVYFPLRFLLRLFPGFLPYQFSASADTPLGEFSLELILLQIVMPTVLEYSRTFVLFKTMVRAWCHYVGGWLGLESYLLPRARDNGDDKRRANNNAGQEAAAPLAEDPAENERVNAGVEGGGLQPPIARENNHLGMRHQALLMVREPQNHEDYDKPSAFAIRIILLLVCLALTTMALSFAVLLIPVTIGRWLLSYLTSSSDHLAVHDLYAMATGLYTCWLLAKGYAVTYEWLEKGWSYMKRVSRSTAWLALRIVAGAVPLLGVVPFLLGLYFQLLVVSPLRASVRQTPLFFPWKEWAMGIVHFKIFCASVMMGPDWWLKAAIDRIYADGVRGFRLGMLYSQLVLPVLNFLSLQIAFPYVVAKAVLYFTDTNEEDQIVWTRYSYPLCLLLFATAAFLSWQWNKLKALIEKIRNDRYLIGTQLVNFHKEVVGSSQAAQISHSKAE